MSENKFNLESYKMGGEQEKTAERDTLSCIAYKETLNLNSAMNLRLLVFFALFFVFHHCAKITTLGLDLHFGEDYKNFSRLEIPTIAT